MVSHYDTAMWFSMTAAPLKPLGALSCETPDDYEGIYLSVTRCHITSVAVPSGRSHVLVPPGLCLTVAAFQTQLEECSQLQKEITTLEKIVQGKLAGDLKQQCEKTVSLFGLTPVCGSVEAALVTLLGTLDPSTSFAVRSSAVGEDSEDLSAAGQNATFLGVQRHEELYTRKIIYSYLGGGQTDKRASERLSDYVAKLATRAHARSLARALGRSNLATSHYNQCSLAQSGRPLKAVSHQVTSLATLQ
uniref:Pyruvate phosphate dikinase AMP/ATP-binding domain-containing protein n=1 Tax=Timema tahoe TaxID=61484 RepID=A0A7R9NZ11_9NEOP|nr:unnamed protein product [Timema tahoe]